MLDKAEVHEKVWGREIWLANNNMYCGKIMELVRGWRCSYHYHKIKDETFYMLEGRLLMEKEGQESVMMPGDVIRIMPNEKHRFTGLEDSRIIEISTYHDENDSYRESGMLSGMVPDDEFSKLKKKYGFA